MLSHVYSCAVIGLDGVTIDIEVDYGQGKPGRIAIVGLPDEAVKESKERVFSAIKNSELAFPRKALTINLAPATVRKEGPAFDLPIAVGILITYNQLPQAAIEDAMFIGELSLDGSLRHVRGVLSIAAHARAEGFKQLYVPEMDAAEAALIPDIEVYPVKTLSELVSHLTGGERIPIANAREIKKSTELFIETDFSEVKGQENIKRALEVAAAGGHNVLMSGSPGAGKTLMARALCSILPRLSIDEALEVTRIYSICDMLPPETPLIQTRPFRAPHHTISHAGMVGGGHIPRPGEISLSHRGVLFLDELLNLVSACWMFCANHGR